MFLTYAAQGVAIVRRKLEALREEGAQHLGCDDIMALALVLLEADRAIMHTHPRAFVPRE